jgi:hypothetical protein
VARVPFICSAGQSAAAAKNVDCIMIKAAMSVVPEENNIILPTEWLLF